jgi:tRNA(fMet)-specific endonuclease VapC
LSAPRFLLDTNVLSEPVRARPSPAILARLRRHAHEIATASIVWHELLFGANRLARSRRRSALERYLQEVVLRTLPVLPYDAAAAAWHARERARLEKRGRPAPFVGGQIAAIARVNDLVLVTANPADFRAFEGLAIADWSRARA